MRASLYNTGPIYLIILSTSHLSTSQDSVLAQPLHSFLQGDQDIFYVLIVKELHVPCLGFWEI